MTGLRTRTLLWRARWLQWRTARMLARYTRAVDAAAEAHRALGAALLASRGDAR